MKNVARIVVLLVAMLMITVPAYAWKASVKLGNSSNRLDFLKEYSENGNEMTKDNRKQFVDIEHSLTQLYLELCYDKNRIFQPYVLLGTGAITEVTAVYMPTNEDVTFKGEYGLLYGYGIRSEIKINEKISLLADGSCIEQGGDLEDYSGKMNSKQIYLSALLKYYITDKFAISAGPALLDEDLEGELKNAGQQWIKKREGKEEPYNLMKGENEWKRKIERDSSQLRNLILRRLRKGKKIRMIGKNSLT